MPNALDLGSEPVDIRRVLPDEVLRVAASLRFWVAEDARSARAFLKRVSQVHPLACALQDIAITPWPRAGDSGRAHGIVGTQAAHPAGPKGRQSLGAAGLSSGAAGPRGRGDRTNREDRGSREPGADPAAAAVWRELLAPALRGEDLGLISEAGLPAVADPGAELVAAAHVLGIAVVPLPGPSALMLALAASGLQGQRFAFVGYLPQDPQARAARIRELEQQSQLLDQTQIAIETPYRNPALLEGLLSVLADTTLLSISQGLTLADASSRTDSVAGWRAARGQEQPRGASTGTSEPVTSAAGTRALLDARTPAVFLFLAQRRGAHRRNPP